MKTHRFIVMQSLNGSYLILKENRVVRQMREVLKLRPGEVVQVADGQGNEVRAQIKAYGHGTAELEVQGDVTALSDAATHVTLYCAILKRDNFELVVQKATELGVFKIVPLLTDKTIKKGLRLDRLHSIALEAAEQCGRNSVPVITEPVSVAEALQQAAHDELWWCDMAGAAPAEATAKAGRGVFIGPEGGWSASETQQAHAAKAQIISLTPTTLRGETAAIVAVYKALSTTVSILPLS